jgi:hypothetical protein
MSEDSGASPAGRGSAALVVQTPRMSWMAIVMDVARHVLPLLSLYVFHGNFAGYVLLTAFDLSLGLMLIVATTRERGDVNSVDPRSRWLVMRFIAWLVAAAFLALVSAIIAIPIAMPAFIFGMITDIDWSALTSHPGFWGPVAAMSLLAAARFQRQFEATTTPGKRGQPTSKGPIIGNLDQDRRQSLAAKAAQITLIATFAALCYVLIVFGRHGLYALPVIYAALLVFYDIRPDIGQRIFPKLWQEK